jgi:hypothetical protein
VSAAHEILKFLPPALYGWPFLEGQRGSGAAGAGALWGVEARVHLLKKSIITGVASR